MGKYMKKGQITGNVAVQEIAQPSSLGVRTRARTLTSLTNLDLPYIQLCTRLLKKPPPPSNKGCYSEGVNSKTQVGRVESVHNDDRKKGSNKNEGDEQQGHFGHFTDEVSSDSGNKLDFDPTQRFVLSYAASTSRDRDVDNKGFVSDSFEMGWRSQESTPCSLTTDPDAISTPGSTTRPTRSTAASNLGHNIHSAFPTTQEIEEFFAGFEHHQHESFLQKYNYDIENDKPRPGRYEWVRVGN